MLLIEEHKISRNSHKTLFRQIDDYCYRAKNLYNSTNYLIRQCHRIHRKLHTRETLESWEEEMASRINEGVLRYNAGRDENRQLRYVDGSNGFIADPYFLSWYLKASPEYKDVPYATCSQICMQELCRAWKSFYKALPVWQKTPERFNGRPRSPGYLDPKEGRGWLVLTGQNIRVEEDGLIRMPGFLKDVRVRTRQKDIRQARITTSGKDCVRILLVYEKKEDPPVTGRGMEVMGIDLGVNNLVTTVWNSGHAPVILNGRPLKSINRYYNKERARLQEAAKKGNRRERTRCLDRLTRKRNNKIKDYLHKTSRKIIGLAKASGTGTIVIGNNQGWKQKVNMGKKTNQTFVSIPYRMLIEIIRYKAKLAGIEVRTVPESYTSGTSYLDGEGPDKEHYDKTRRVYRGLFRSNTGIYINADVNAAYQIMKLGGVEELKIKEKEQVTRIKVS